LLDYPLIYHEDKRFKLYQNQDFLKQYDDKFIDQVNKWLDIISVAGNFVDHKNILDNTSRKMTKLILDWYEYNFKKQLNINSLKIYQDMIY
jgi:hypothetical protein